MSKIKHISKEKIVLKARSWIGTKFFHQGRLKKSKEHDGGCDCLGLIMGIAKELSLKTKHNILVHDLDEANYSNIPDGGFLLQKLSGNFIQKNIAEISIGDLALFSFAKNPQHLGIIGDVKYESIKRLTLIHAYSPAGYVCEHLLDRKWLRRLIAVYRLV